MVGGEPEQATRVPAASDPEALTLRYLTAQEVSGTTVPPSASPLWRQVKAVRLCLVLRSELEVQDSAMRYTNCQGLPQTAPDRRLYRAFQGSRYTDAYA